MSGGGGDKKQVSVPTVGYDSGGLFGSGTAGGKNSFKPTDFQSNLVKQTESAIPQYMNQLIKPSYDSEVFKAKQNQFNRFSKQAFENNVMNPLASRNLTRGSSINQMSNEFAANQANTVNDMMATEDSRVSNVLNQLFNAYQVPYNMMMGMQGNASQLAQAQMQAQAQLDAANAQKSGDLFSGLASGLGSMAGGYLQGKGSSGLTDALLKYGPSIASLASDKRLKENIEKLDTVNDYNIYRFDYINGAKNQIGVIAQEILDIQPEAVGLDDNGYYFVMYGLLPDIVQKRIHELKLI